MTISESDALAGAISRGAGVHRPVDPGAATRAAELQHRHPTDSPTSETDSAVLDPDAAAALLPTIIEEDDTEIPTEDAAHLEDGPIRRSGRLRKETKRFSHRAEVEENLDDSVYRKSYILVQELQGHVLLALRLVDIGRGAKANQTA
jgi:hypothetical protein